MPGFVGSGTITFGSVGVGVVPPTVLYCAVNVFSSTVPVVGTCGSHFSNSFVVSLYAAVVGNFAVTS